MHSKKLDYDLEINFEVLPCSASDFEINRISTKLKYLSHVFFILQLEKLEQIEVEQASDNKY